MESRQPPMASVTSRARPPSARWVLAVSLLAFVCYLASWGAVHSWDSIAYTARVLGDPLLSEAFLSTSWLHPHHLIYVPLGQLAAFLLGPFTRDPFAPLLLLSSVTGAGTVALGAWLASRAAGTRAAGLAAAGILAFANSTWLYSTAVEVMMPALCFLLTGGALLVRSGRRAALLAGLAVALAVLTHQITVFHAVALSVGLAHSRDRRTIPFVAAWMVPVGTLYVLAAVLYAGALSPAEVVAWSVAAGSRHEYDVTGFARSTYGAARTAAEGLVTLVPVTRFRTGATRDAGTILGAAAALLVLAGTLVGLVQAIRARPPARPDEAQADPEAQRVLTAFLAGTLATSLFIAWFQARTLDYWVYAVAGLALWVCGRLPRPAPAVFAAWLFTLAGVNCAFRVLPMRDPANAPYAECSRFASKHMKRGDRLWLGPEDEALELSLVVLPFYHGVLVARLGPPEQAARERGSERRQRSAPAVPSPRDFVTESALSWLPGEPRTPAAVDSVGSLLGARIFLLRPGSN